LRVAFNRVNTVRWIVLIAVVQAAVTGLVLIISPPLFAKLVFGAQFSEAGQALGRLTGIALLGFVLASWPAAAVASPSAWAVRALAIYNLLAAVYLLYLGIGGQLVGILLWPAVALHAFFAIVVGRAWLGSAQQVAPEVPRP